MVMCNHPEQRILTCIMTLPLSNGGARCLTQPRFYLSLFYFNYQSFAKFNGQLSTRKAKKAVVSPPIQRTWGLILFSIPCLPIEPEHALA